MAVVLAVIFGTLVVAPTPASARTGGCYGASCKGLNPSGLCDDGITIASVGVKDGALDMRYSRSCAANWGRYTPYARNAGSKGLLGGTGIYARVTVWNPGGPSYGLAYSAPGITGSSWSQMTDGRFRACTGVEVVYVLGLGNYESQGWAWGPCH